MSPATHGWWRSAVTYQVYIRSFADGNGDGIGDIAGVRTRLRYLRELGVDAIWINPWYLSPMADAGYDVADYRAIEPLFGTLAEAEALISEAHEHGLRVLLDIVPNHTSDRHDWFQAALAAPPGSRERARYLFRNGRGDNGDEPPNDWRSCFTGPAWTRTTAADGTPGQWYLHLFTPEQPDLDWSNDDVRAELLAVLEFWLGRGVDGFRVDVAHGMVKAPGLPDVGYASLDLDDNAVAFVWDVFPHPHWDQEGLHEIYRSWRALSATYPEVAFVAEAEVGAIDRYARYTRPGGLQQAFNFPFIKARWDAATLRSIIDETVRAFAAVGAAPSWVLGNHDLPRVTSRHADGDATRGARRARAATLLMLGLPGGAYIYQGDELGLPECEDLPADARQDPIFHRSGGTLVGRDGCRVPLPWSGTEPPFGFNADGATSPWLPQPSTWAALTAEAQEDDPSSTLALHRAALRLRRSHPGLAGERFSWVESAPDVLHVEREVGFSVLTNLGPESVLLPTGTTVVLASGPLDGIWLPPDTTVWLPPDTTVWLSPDTTVWLSPRDAG